MSDINWERLVVVTAIHGEKYLGWVPSEIEDPKKYLDEHGWETRPVVLTDVRNLIGQASPNVSPQGKLLGFSKVMLLMPLDLLDGPIARYHILPSAWYFPGEHGDDCKKHVEELLHQAVENEAQMSARSAGLHLAGTLPRNHP